MSAGVKSDSRKTTATTVIVRRCLMAASALVLVGIAVLVAQQSPLSPGSVNYPGTESSLHIYASSQILDGILPYRDLLTFTGPMVFFIDSIGYMINGEFGIWIGEIVVLAGAFMFLYFSLNRHVGPLSSLVVCLTVASFIPLLYEGGNHTETYVFFFQAMGLAGFLDYFKQQTLNMTSVYLIGLGAAMAFLTKPFTLLFWTPFFFIVLIRIIYKEGWMTSFTRMVAILISFFIVFVALIPWLNINNALESCLNQMLFFYLDYVELISAQVHIDTFLLFALSLPFVLTVLISFAALIKMIIVRIKFASDYEKGKLALAEDKLHEGLAGQSGKEAVEAPVGQDEKEAFERQTSEEAEHSRFEELHLDDPVNLLMKRLDRAEFPFGQATPLLMVANLLAAILLFVTMSIPGDQGGHVLMQGIICLAVPLGYVAQFFIKGIYSKSLSRIAIGSVFVLLLLIFVWVPGVVSSVKLAGEQRTSSWEQSQKNELITAIKSSQAEIGHSGEPMVVFGEDCWIYTKSDSYSATRFAYQPFSNDLRPDLNNEFYRQVDIAGNTINGLLLAGRTSEGLIGRYPMIDGYDLIFQNDSYVLYRKQGAIAYIPEAEAPAEAPAEGL